ncbi:MAG: AAA family ATPase [Rhizobacter sp.]|nr:AAA family ATPase [Rhizobacter sp.]
MQLRHLAIPNFRNLRGLVINFATHLEPRPGAEGTAAPKAIRSHALIGQNGTGKSNLIEALITLFRDVDLDRDAAFDYTLEYEIRGHVVRIQADLAKQRRPFVWVDGERVSQDYLNKNDPADKTPRDERRGPRLLPSHVFAYYSGRNERIEALFQDHQKRFNGRQEITADEVIRGDLFASYKAPKEMIALEAALRDFEGRQENELSPTELTNLARIRDALKPLYEQRSRFLSSTESEHRRRSAKLGDDRLRRLFYCRGGHSQLVLLACLLSDDPVFQKVLKTLHIESLESALFVLKEPYRLREKRRNGKFDEVELNEGDPRFWYARGSVVSEFLDSLWQVAWAPIEQEVTQQIDFRGRTEKQRQLYLYVPNQAKLQELGRLVGGTDSFFRYAEGAYIGDLIEEVRITVRKRVDGNDAHDGKVGFTQLSEGELQMLTVLGLMRITREDHCLFLLDEPDTHLNPIWKLRYFDDIEGVLHQDGEALMQGASQVLITTHDPMMIGSLKREQVHILRRQAGHTTVETPDEHPQGMGVTGLLKSELFGLSSTLDVETERRLFRRNELFVKQPRTAEEDAELTRLSAELADLGFSTADFRDPDYALFVRKMAEHRKFRKPTLSPEEQAEQNRVADEIIDEILREEAGK